MNVTNPDTSAEFARLVQVQQVFAEAEANLDAIQAACDRYLTKAVDESRDAYVAAKVVRDQAEEEIRELTSRHPEWMSGRSVKTPFGEIVLREVTKLDVPNPEATVALLEYLCAMPGSGMSLEQLVRTVREPNLEVLETLSDEVLATVGVRRVTTRHTTVKRTRVDLGKRARKASPEPVGKEGV